MRFFLAVVIVYMFLDALLAAARLHAGTPFTLAPTWSALIAPACMCLAACIRLYLYGNEK